MEVIHQLATSLGRRDEAPNVELARRIAIDGDAMAIKQLQELLYHKKKAIRSDTIKVLYEIGDMKPVLISTLFDDFIKCLQSKDNRMVWGAMTALQTLGSLDENKLVEQLPLLRTVAAKGSVIARDQFVKILERLHGFEDYRPQVADEMQQILLKAPATQFPSYAETAARMASPESKAQFATIVAERLKHTAKASQKKRLERVLKRIAK